MVVTTKQNKPELKVSIDNNPIKQSHCCVSDSTYTQYQLQRSLTAGNLH